MPPDFQQTEVLEKDANGIPLALPPEVPREIGSYVIQRVLGEGGMGRVYLARDTKLDRLVALKVLRRGEPDLLRRFVQEARAQAQVTHEGVCRIYEAGEHAGTAYIAMEFIDGKTLSQSSWALRAEEKIDIVRRVAEALHAAHRAGLVHRDLKPDNVMVAAQGQRPVILDFGLARQQAASATLTVAGLIVGTPAYMAPEQALGQNERIDRRTDVYALGVTLFELFTRRTPFHAGSAAELLLKIVNEEPPRLRTLAPAVSRDLEAIVARCLEREPGHRYDSALALAEDLSRLAAGLPTQARPLSRRETLARALRRHRVAVGLGLAALLVAGGLLASALSARRDALERARVAQRFGQEAERIESLVRTSAMLPVHDVRRERAAFGKKALALAAEASGLEASRRAPALLAAGRAFLALDQPRAARETLESAWNAGFRTPETALSLGLSYGKLFQAELARLDRLPRELRGKRRLELEKELRAPALAYLGLATNAETAESLLLAGNVALYDGRYAEAAAQGRSAAERSPVSWEALALSGEASLLAAAKLNETGDVPGARRAYDEAAAVLRKGLEIARSEPSLARLLTLTLAKRYEALVLSGQPGAEAFREASEAARTARSLDPGDGEAYRLEALALFWRGEELYAEGKDSVPSLLECIRLAEEGMRLAPADPAPFNLAGSALGRLGDVMAGRKEDPRPYYRRAAAAVRKALERNPQHPAALANLGLAEQSLGDEEAARGGSPVAAYAAAVAAFDKAIESAPALASALANKANPLVGLAEWQHRSGEDPGAALAAAEEACLEALRRNPSESLAMNNLAYVYLLRARFAARAGEASAASHFQKGEEAYEKALAARPTNLDSLRSLAGLLEERAAWEKQRGADGAEVRQRLAGVFARARALEPGCDFCPPR
ncbi:MAG: protein kinase [Acidobacteria bacterium]|nr:protein kinase [Acidobacteriota bacterium]